ncbi:MAG: RsmD family RNA methyltransferase [Endomicrobiia bacterium]
MLKIIAGEKSGFELKSPENIRPILARIKKSVFDIIRARISQSIFLDLFAGSGSVGLEALSRGAKSVVFVEKEKRCISVLYENINFLQYREKSFVINADVLKDLFWIDKVRKYLTKSDTTGFDIIFVGAPYVGKVTNYKFGIKDLEHKFYNFKSKDKVLLNLCSPTVKLIYNSEIMKKDGIMIVQRSIKENLDFYKYKCIRTEKYGDTIVDFLSY